MIGEGGEEKKHRGEHKNSKLGNLGGEKHRGGGMRSDSEWQRSSMVMRKWSKTDFSHAESHAASEGGKEGKD